MPEIKRKKPSGTNKKQAPKPAIRNRYHRRAKLSEYKFLQILKGFAENATAAELAAPTRISEKTIREAYKSLRASLFEAVLRRPKGFGGTGFFLFNASQMTDRGRLFLVSVAESELFAAHIARHNPRAKSAEETRALLFEVTVRVFCNIAMRKDATTLYPEQTRQSLDIMREIAQWIRENREKDGFYQTYAELIARFGRVVGAMPALLEREELLALRDKSIAHRYPDHILYEELRQYLLKHPLSG